MSNFELTLTQFLFPEDLPNKKANFRFVVDLRFTNDKGQFTTEHAVMPSLDTFWECDTSRKDNPNYVRNCFKHTNSKEHNEECSRFNMNGTDDKKGIDEWDRLILLVKGKDLHSIQFKVIDVDRKDAWDKVKNFLGGIVETVIGKVKSVVPEKLPLSLHGSLGAAADDVQSFLLKKLAGGNDVLFRGSATLEEKQQDSESTRNDKQQDGEIRSHKVSGRGTNGHYQIEFNLAKV